MASFLVLLVTRAQALDDALPCHGQDPQRGICLTGAVERHVQGEAPS